MENLWVQVVAGNYRLTTLNRIRNLPRFAGLLFTYLCSYLSPSDYPRSHGTLRGSLYSLSTEGTPPYKFSKIFRYQYLPPGIPGEWQPESPDDALILSRSMPQFLVTPCLSVFTTLQATHHAWSQSNVFFRMDRKRMILIVSFLGRIQVALRKMHGKAGRKTVTVSCSSSWASPRPLGAGLTITLTNGS